MDTKSGMPPPQTGPFSPFDSFSETWYRCLSDSLIPPGPLGETAPFPSTLPPPQIGLSPPLETCGRISKTHNTISLPSSTASSANRTFSSLGNGVRLARRRLLIPPALSESHRFHQLFHVLVEPDFFAHLETWDRISETLIDTSSTP